MRLVTTPVDRTRTGLSTAGDDVVYLRIKFEPHSRDITVSSSQPSPQYPLGLIFPSSSSSLSLFIFLHPSLHFSGHQPVVYIPFEYLIFLRFQLALSVQGLSFPPGIHLDS